MTRWFVAGPMRGYPDGNRAEFGRVAGELAELGWLVENPALGVEASEPGAAFRTTLRQLLACDGICLLAGWKASRAVCEANVALWCGLVVAEWDYQRHRPVVDPALHVPPAPAPRYTIVRPRPQR